MKRITFLRSLLIAAMLSVGASTWAETFGTTTDSYLGERSASVTLADGGTINYVFSQTTAATANAQGFVLVAKIDENSQPLIALRGDKWENVAWNNVGITDNYDWTDFPNLMNGASVNMTITYNSGSFEMNAAITGSDGNEYSYSYTKEIESAPSSLVVYLSEEAAVIRLGKTAVTNGTITTTTYDFQSMISSNTTFTYGDNYGKAYGQTAKIPTNISAFTDNRFSLWDRGSFWSISPTGLTHAHSGNSSNTGGLYIGNMMVGDKIIYTYMATTGTIQAGSTNSSGNTTFTHDGTTISYWTTLNSGTTYYITSGNYASVIVGKTVTVTSISIISNTSANYSSLFTLWKEAVANYNNEEYTEGKIDLSSAIAAAKAVIDDSDATETELSNAIIALREANEYFTATNTKNTSYRVTSSSIMSDGTNVKSVYGITMTYHGTWTWTTERNGNAAGTSVPTLTNNIPTTGDYWEFKPTVDGTLTMKAAWFGDQYYRLVDAANGHIVYEYRQGHNNNDYDSYVDYGSLIAGKTYYFYRTSTTNGYYLGGFTFTPGENTRDSYYTSSGEIVKGGTVIDQVAGITMTYGGTSEDSWTLNNIGNTDRGWINKSAATVSNNIPSDGTYIVLHPAVNGKLSLSWYAFGSGNAILSDGNKTESIPASSSGNGNKTAVFSTILSGGTTYYVYFSTIKNYTNGFWGFSYDTSVPATVDASIGSTGFATFSSTYPLDFSATSMKAYSASLTTDKTVLLTPVTAVPANTGILLKGATEAIPVKAGFVTAPATNLFKASTDEEITASVEGTYHYVLANGSNGVGFYNLAAAKNIGTGKAYLETTEALMAESSADNARAMWVFADDETTGINTISGKWGKGNSEYYNLNGQRVTAPQKGLYIVNGKKIIMK